MRECIAFTNPREYSVFRLVREISHSAVNLVCEIIEYVAYAYARFDLTAQGQQLIFIFDRLGHDGAFFLSRWKSMIRKGSSFTTEMRHRNNDITSDVVVGSPVSLFLPAFPVLKTTLIFIPLSLCPHAAIFFLPTVGFLFALSRA